MGPSILFHSEYNFTLSKQEVRSKWINNSIINESKRVGAVKLYFLHRRVSVGEKHQIFKT